MSKKSRPWGRRARARIRRRTERWWDRPRYYTNGALLAHEGPLTFEDILAAQRELDRVAPAPEPLEYTDLFRSMGVPPELLFQGANVFDVIRESQEAIARAADIPASRLFGFEMHDDAADAARYALDRPGAIDVEVVTRALPAVPTSTQFEADVLFERATGRIVKVLPPLKGDK